jgi:UPF0716 family protein affecting phage T7 exclusion
MAYKFLKFFLVIVVSIMLASAFISVALLLIPGIVTDFFCPTGLVLTLSSYSMSHSVQREVVSISPAQERRTRELSINSW